MTSENPGGKSPSSGETKIGPIALMVIVLVGIVAVIFLFTLKKAEKLESVEAVVVGEDTNAPAVNLGQVIDAVTQRDVKAQEGYRYEVIIDSESEDGIAGIAHIGGLVTFVNGARPGERVIIDVTRIGNTTANAVVVKRIGMDPSAARPRPRDAQPMMPSVLMIGQTYEGVVSDMGKRGDGLVRVKGKVVFVSGAKVGDRVSFKITEDGPRAARGDLVSVLQAGAGVEAAPSAGGASFAPPAGDSAADVVAGAEFEVTVDEKSRKNPDTEGVAHIKGLVVFVAGCQPGDKARVRITSRQARFATAEIVEKLAPAP